MEQFKNLIKEDNLKGLEEQTKSRKISKERGEIIKRVSDFSKERGNELDFFDFGDEILEKSANNCNLQKRIIIGLNNKDIEILNDSLVVFKSYISGNIFTDQFLEHKNFSNLEDLKTRVGWEKANIYDGSLNEEDLEYYRSNRLNIGSRVHPTLGYLDTITEIIKDPVAKRELEILRNQIPEELRENIIFNKLKNEDKIERIIVFSEIIKKVIKILEESQNLTESK